MTHRLLALGLALAFGLAQAPAASAQAGARALDDWTAVQTLSPGQKIVVRTRDGDRLSGRFDSANDLLINFTDGRRKVSLTRESVRLVQLDRGNSRRKGALFGALIGGAAGFAFGSALYFKDDMVDTTIPASAAMGMAIGAGIGAATGKGNKNETVYEAR